MVFRLPVRAGLKAIIFMERIFQSLDQWRPGDFLEMAKVEVEVGVCERLKLLASESSDKQADLLLISVTRTYRLKNGLTPFRWQNKISLQI